MVDAAALAAARKRRAQLAAHPLANVGGYQTLIASTVGAAASGSSAPATATKRAKTGAAQPTKAAPAKPLSQADQEFIAKRNAARARMLARNAAEFGK